MESTNFSCSVKHICFAADYCKQTSGMCARGRFLAYALKQSYLPASRYDVPELWCIDEDVAAFERLSKLESGMFYASSDNLYLCSEQTGNGKTSWAIRLMLKYLEVCSSSILEKHYDALTSVVVFVPVIQFIHDAKSPFGSSFYHKYEQLASAADKAELVVWDDIGMTEYTAYDFMHLFRAVDRRLFAGKKNIFTSNHVDMESLEEAVGLRLADRIWNSCEIIQLCEGSKR